MIYNQNQDSQCSYNHLINDENMNLLKLKIKREFRQTSQSEHRVQLRDIDEEKLSLFTYLCNKTKKKSFKKRK